MTQQAASSAQFHSSACFLSVLVFFLFSTLNPPLHPPRGDCISMAAAKHVEQAWEWWQGIGRPRHVCAPMVSMTVLRFDACLCFHGLGACLSPMIRMYVLRFAVLSSHPLALTAAETQSRCGTRSLLSVCWFASTGSISRTLP